MPSGEPCVWVALPPSASATRNELEGSGKAVFFLHLPLQEGGGLGPEAGFALGGELLDVLLLLAHPQKDQGDTENLVEVSC